VNRKPASLFLFCFQPLQGFKFSVHNPFLFRLKFQTIAVAGYPFLFSPSFGRFNGSTV
jgi:hypothetical protein